MNATAAKGSANATSPNQGLSRKEAITWCALFATEGLIIVVGNALAVTIFSRTRQLQKRSLYLVMNLVAADLLVGALAIPSWIYSILGWSFGSTASLFLELVFPIIDMISSFASIGCLVALAAERLHATFRPLQHRLIGGGFYLACIISMWTLALFPIPLRLAIYYRKIQRTVIVVWLPVQFALLVLICTAYMAIWIKLRFGERNHGQQATERDRKLTMVLLFVAVVALFAWLPFIIFNIVYFVAPALYHYRALYAIKLIHYGNSLVNPMIYPFRMPVFRRAMVRMICRARQVRPLQRGGSCTLDSVRESTLTAGEQHSVQQNHSPDH